MKAVITGGGTGGHIYPALSVAEELDKKEWEIIYIGSSNSLEKKIINNTKFPFKTVDVLPLPRKINFKLFKSIFFSIKATYRAFKIIKDIRPDIVFGTGGYVTGPVLLAAYFNKVPTVVHEQNIFPGITNKLLSYFVNKIAVNNIEAQKYFSSKVKNKIIETGNPIRSSILDIKKEKGFKKLKLNPDKKTLFIMGGSQGSETLNNALIESLEKLMNLDDLQIILITGSKNYDNIINKIEKYIKKYNNRLLVFPYLDNIELAYAVSDLIVYRAGATGLAEITALGIPAILVPFPYSAEGHQEINAKFLEDSNAAVMVKDSDFNGDVLFKLIKEILYDENKLDLMKENSKKLAKLNASKKIVNVIENLVREE